MYKKLWEKIKSEYSEDKAKDNIVEIYNSDVICDYQAFENTANWCEQQMQKAGLDEVQIIPFTADGKTKLGDFTPAIAWNVESAKLAITIPGENKPNIIADHDKIPISLAMYSASTPRNGITAEIVDFDSITDDKKIRGKIILTSKRVSEIIDKVMPAGAVGIISDYISCRRYSKTDIVEEAVYWENNCFKPLNTSNGFAFIISPLQGRKLRQLLLDFPQQVTAHALVKTHSYSGHGFAVTGIIKGSDPEAGEVWTVSHLAEIGANDNASGCGVNLEIARTLRKLIDDRVISQPKRSIRIVLGPEIFGVLACYKKIKAEGKKILSSIDIDMVGEDPEKTGGLLQLCRCSPYNPSFISDLLVDLFENSNSQATLPWREFEDKYNEADEFITDPMLNVPSPMLMHWPDKFYHSDQDTPDKLSLPALKRIGIITAVYLYFQAGAGLKESSWLSSLCAEKGGKRLADEVDAFMSKATSGNDIDKEELLNNFIIKLKRRTLIETGTIASVANLALNKNDYAVIRANNETLLVELKQKIFNAELNARKLLESTETYLEKIDADTDGASALQKKAHSIIPERSFFGPIILWCSDIETQNKFNEVMRGCPVESHAALMLTDGNRSIRDIYQILKLHNTDLTLETVMMFFERSEKAGFLSFSDNNKITKDDLICDFRKMGIEKNDILLVHSSLRSLGDVDGGADTVVDALLETVGKNGMIIMPALSRTFVGDDKPFNVTGYAFDLKTTPSRVGAISEAFRQRKNAFRSLHPTHSLSAIGKGAENLLKGHDKGSTFDIDGPYGNYVRMNAKVLFIGTGLSCNTTLHCIEDWLALPYMAKEKSLLRNSDGCVDTVEVTMSPSGHRGFYGKNQRIAQATIEKCKVKTAKVANAEVILINSKDIISGILEIMLEDGFDFLLCGSEDCDFCFQGKNKIEKDHDRLTKRAKKILETNL